MKSGILIPICSLAGALLVTSACQQRNDAEDIAKTKRESAEEVARLRREADEKVAAAQREADKKIEAAKEEAAKDIAEKQKETMTDLVKERRELEQAVERAKQETLVEYRDYVAKRARLIELREAELAATPAAGTPEYVKFKQDLETRKTKLQSTLKELEKIPTNLWRPLKTRLDAELHEIEGVLDRMERPPSTRAKR